MNDKSLDKEQIKKAKEQAAGPLGNTLNEFPLLFVLPCYFGRRPVKDQPTRVNNGTVTLIKLGKKRIAITCCHVLEAYREISFDNRITFQIGKKELNPLERIIDESSDLDIVTIDITDIDDSEILQKGKIGSCFFNPSKWPPNRINNGDIIAFGGFPGKWRQYPSWNEIKYGTFSNGACQVTSVRDEYFIVQFERAYWVESFNNIGKEDKPLDDIAGLSGGPVLIHRGLYWELVGIISEFSKQFDLMRVCTTQCINIDGTINKK